MRDITKLIIKGLIFIASLGIVFWGAIENNIISVSLGFLIFLVIYKFTSKSEFKIIASILQNLIFWFYIIFLAICTIFLAIGISFILSNEQFIEFLIGISFTLAGFTLAFIAIIWDKENEKDTILDIISSCVMFLLSGFFYFLELGARHVEPISPLTNIPITGYNFMKILTPSSGLFASTLFSTGIFLIIFIIIRKAMQIRKEMDKKELKISFKQSLRKFVGLEY